MDSAILVERCEFLASGELGVLNGDRYVYARYCVETPDLELYSCSGRRGSDAVAIFVQRRGEQGCDWSPGTSPWVDRSGVPQSWQTAMVTF